MQSPRSRRRFSLSTRIGLYNTANVEVHDSLIIGTEISIDNTGVSAMAYVSNSELSPTVAGPGASFHCVSAYKGVFLTLSVFCT